MCCDYRGTFSMNSHTNSAVPDRHLTVSVTYFLPERCLPCIWTVALAVRIEASFTFPSFTSGHSLEQSNQPIKDILFYISSALVPLNTTKDPRYQWFLSRKAELHPPYPPPPPSDISYFQSELFTTRVVKHPHCSC